MVDHNKMICADYSSVLKLVFATPPGAAYTVRLSFAGGSDASEIAGIRPYVDHLEATGVVSEWYFTDFDVLTWVRTRTVMTHEEWKCAGMTAYYDMIAVTGADDERDRWARVLARFRADHPDYRDTWLTAAMVELFTSAVDGDARAAESIREHSRLKHLSLYDFKNYYVLDHAFGLRDGAWKKKRHVFLGRDWR